MSACRDRRFSSCGQGRCLCLYSERTGRRLPTATKRRRAELRGDGEHPVPRRLGAGTARAARVAGFQLSLSSTAAAGRARLTRVEASGGRRRPACGRGGCPHAGENPHAGTGGVRVPLRCPHAEERRPAPPRARPPARQAPGVTQAM